MNSPNPKSTFERGKRSRNVTMLVTTIWAGRENMGLVSLESDAIWNCRTIFTILAISARLEMTLWSNTLTYRRKNWIEQMSSGRRLLASTLQRKRLKRVTHPRRTLMSTLRMWTRLTMTELWNNRQNASTCKKSSIFGLRSEQIFSCTCFCASCVKPYFVCRSRGIC